jgi:hypothetical protein
MFKGANHVNYVRKTVIASLSNNNTFVTSNCTKYSCIPTVIKMGKLNSKVALVTRAAAVIGRADATALDALKNLGDFSTFYFLSNNQIKAVPCTNEDRI